MWVDEYVGGQGCGRCLSVFVCVCVCVFDTKLSSQGVVSLSFSLHAFPTAAPHSSVLQVTESWVGDPVG